MTAESLRTRAYIQLAPEAWPKKGLSPVNSGLFLLILTSVLFSIAETEPDLETIHPLFFRRAELLFGIIFLVEYLARFWAAAEKKGPGSILRKRLSHLLSLAALVDLAVIALTFAPFTGINGQMLRLVRLFRIIRLAKLGRMSAAMRHLVFALDSRRYELALTMMFALCVLIFGASALYWIEGDVQPDRFGSIPRALWWAVTTLTTTGYGDVYPITPAGKVVAAIIALAGIAFVAMPAGILASAFSEALRRDPGTSR